MKVCQRFALLALLLSVSCIGCSPVQQYFMVLPTFLWIGVKEKALAYRSERVC